MENPDTPRAPLGEGSSSAEAHAHLDAAEAADDETRLQVLEDLYRSLESGLEGSGNPSSS